MKKRLIGTLALAATVALALTACSGTGQEPVNNGGDGSATTPKKDLTYAVVTHSGPGDSF